MSLFDEDGGFSKPKGKVNLGGLFDDESDGSTGTSALTYKAPKEPKPKQQQQAAAPVVQEQATNGASNGAPVISITLYKYEASQHVEVGKARVTLKGTSTLHIYTKNDTAVSMQVSPALTFTVQNDVYGSFYDSSNQNWTMLFKTVADIDVFAAMLSFAKLHAAQLRDVVSQDIVVGTVGKLPIDTGDTLGVKYTGYIVSPSGALADQFDSNANAAGVLKVVMGDGSVIAGLERGMRGMRKGGRRVLVIPPQLAYGAAGSPPRVPANATLAFTVEVTKLKSRDADSVAPTPQRSRSGTGEIDPSSIDAAHKADLVARMARLGQAQMPQPAAVAPAPAAQPVQQQQQQPQQQQQQYQQALTPYMAPQQQQQQMMPPFGYHPYYPPPQQQQAPQPIIVNTMPAPSNNNSNGNSNGNNNNNSNGSSNDSGKRESVEDLVERKQFRTKVVDSLDVVQSKVADMERKLTQAIVLKSDEDSGLSPIQLLQSIQRIVAENDRVTADLAKKTQVIEQLREKVATLHSQNEAFIDQKNEMLEQKNHSLNTATEQSRRQLAALEQEKAVLAKELADQTVTLSALRTELAATQRRAVAAETARDEASTEAARLAKRVVELTPAKEEAEVRENELRARLDVEKQYRVSAEQRAEHELADKLAALRDVERHQAELADLRQRAAADAQALREAAKEEAARAADVLAAERASSAEARSHATKGDTALAAANASLADVKTQLKNSQAELKTAQADLKTAHADTAAAKSQASKAASSAGASQASIDAALAAQREVQTAEVSDAFKKIMSQVYFAAAEQIDENATHKGSAVLKLLMKAIKAETLTALARLKEGKSLAESDDENEEEVAKPETPVAAKPVSPKQPVAAEPVAPEEPTAEEDDAPVAAPAPKEPESDDETEPVAAAPAMVEAPLVEEDENGDENGDDEPAKPVAAPAKAVVAAPVAREASPAPAPVAAPVTPKASADPLGGDDGNDSEEWDEDEDESSKPAQKAAKTVLDTPAPSELDGAASERSTPAPAKPAAAAASVASPLDDDPLGDGDNSPATPVRAAAKPAVAETPTAVEKTPVKTVETLKETPKPVETPKRNDSPKPVETPTQAAAVKSPLGDDDLFGDNKSSASSSALFDAPAPKALPAVAISKPASQKTTAALDDLFANDGKFSFGSGGDDLFAAPAVKKSPLTSVLSDADKQKASADAAAKAAADRNNAGAMSFLDDFKVEESGLFGD